MTIHSAVSESAFWNELLVLKPQKADVSIIETNHSKKYIEEVRRTAEHGGGYLDMDTGLSAQSYEAALYAVGAGITGVLFMRALGGLARREDEGSLSGSGIRPFDSRALAQAALSHVKGRDPGSGESLAHVTDSIRTRPAHAPVGRRRNVPAGGIAGASVVVLAAGLLVWSFSSIPAHDTTLGVRVEAALPGSGLMNPVTAVLLDFRGYDTLLEVGVLVVAALAVMIIGAPRHSPLLSETSVRGRVLSTFAHLIIPAIVLAAVAVGWRWELAGGILFLGLAGWYLAMTASWAPWSAYLLFAGVPALLGILFLVDWRHRAGGKRHA